MTASKMIYFITGASGVGKTTLIDGLKEKYTKMDWLFLHFDSIGVPSFEEMEREYGSPSAWQEAKTHEWIDKLINAYHNEKVFLEGQVNMQFIIDGFKKRNFKNYEIILIDCNEEEMSHRLTHQRNQPELLTDDMKNWLKYLRNQARELDVQIIDTSCSSQEQVVREFEKQIGV